MRRKEEGAVVSPVEMYNLILDVKDDVTVIKTQLVDYRERGSRIRKLEIAVYGMLVTVAGTFAKLYASGLIRF